MPANTTNQSTVNKQPQVLSSMNNYPFNQKANTEQFLTPQESYCNGLSATTSQNINNSTEYYTNDAQYTNNPVSMVTLLSASTNDKVNSLNQNPSNFSGQ